MTSPSLWTVGLCPLAPFRHSLVMFYYINMLPLLNSHSRSLSKQRDTAITSSGGLELTSCAYAPPVIKIPLPRPCQRKSTLPASAFHVVDNII